MRLLFIGDVFGSLGREAVENHLQEIKKEYGVNIVIANCENAAHGRGITTKIYKQMMEKGIHVITMGNHTFDNKDILNIIKEDSKLIRPANYPAEVPGKGIVYYNFNGKIVCVINMQGRTFLHPIDCPFKKIDELIEEAKKKTNIILIDFHAEASSEKISFGYYVDGRVSAVVGTHTHVPTADARVLDGGTAYITDVGMTGPLNGVIGMKKEGVLYKFLKGLPTRLEPVEEGPYQFNAVIIDINEKNGKANSIETVKIIQKVL